MSSKGTVSHHSVSVLFAKKWAVPKCQPVVCPTLEDRLGTPQLPLPLCTRYTSSRRCPGGSRQCQLLGPLFRCEIGESHEVVCCREGRVHAPIELVHTTCFFAVEIVFAATAMYFFFRSATPSALQSLSNYDLSQSVGPNHRQTSRQKDRKTEMR